MTTIQDQITQMASATVEMQAKQERVTGTASAQLSQSEFLNLMLMQYQYQDPMEPMNNADMVAQQCQFSQLSATQELANSMTANNAITQATSLVGKSVVLKDPNSENILYGKVEAAYLNGNDSCITVDGKDYPLSYLMYTYDGDATNTSNTTNNTQQANNNNSQVANK